MWQVRYQIKSWLHWKQSKSPKEPYLSPGRELSIYSLPKSCSCSPFPMSSLSPGSTGAEAERPGLLLPGWVLTQTPCLQAGVPASANTFLLTRHSLHVPMQSQTWKPELHCRWLTLFKAVCLTVLKALKTLRWAMKAYQDLGPCVVTAPVNT